MADTNKFTAIGAVDFKSFDWNFWTCDQCGAVVEWNDLDVHEEHHDYEDRRSSTMRKWAAAASVVLFAVAVISSS